MQRPDITEKLAIQDIVSRSMTDAELRAFVASESEKFAKIIQDATSRSAIETASHRGRC